MREILPGVWHWTAMHPKIHMRVSSYHLAASGTVLDPLLPEDEGLDWFRDRPVERVVLTVRHHGRDTQKLAEALGVPVLAHETGLHEFEGSGLEVSGYSDGDEIAPGIRALDVGALAPDDSALHIATGPGILAFGDAIVRYDGRIMFVPDQFMDDPERDKAATYARLRELLDEDFDALLFGHGDPIPSGGKAALREFVDAGG